MRLKMLAGTGLLTLGFTVACGSGDEAATPTKQPKEQAEKPAPKPAEAPMPKPGSVKVGDDTLTAQLCTFDGAEFKGDSSSDLMRSITVVGDKLIIADHEGKLHGFTIDKGDECKLTVDKSFGTDGVLSFENEINWLSSADTGLIIASSGIFDTYGVKDGKQIFTCDATGYAEVSADGTWAILPWVNSTVEMATLTDTGCTKSDWVLKDLSDDEKRQGIFTNVNSAATMGDNILIGGILAKSVDENEPRVVIAYNKAGEEQFRFGDAADAPTEQSFGWIHAVSSCKQGVCVLDSNFRQMSFWNDKGEFVGSADLSKLFDLSYPWFSDFTVAGDGYAYFLTANELGDSDVYEGRIFRVTNISDARIKKAATAKRTPKKAGKKGGKHPIKAGKGKFNGRAKAKVKRR